MFMYSLLIYLFNNLKKDVRAHSYDSGLETSIKLYKKKIYIYIYIYSAQRK